VGRYIDAAAGEVEADLFGGGAGERALDVDIETATQNRRVG
jgi:hypothetical protein